MVEATLRNLKARSRVYMCRTLDAVFICNITCQTRTYKSPICLHVIHCLQTIEKLMSPNIIKQFHIRYSVRNNNIIENEPLPL